MAKYIVNCKDKTVQLGCKLGQFTFIRGEVTDNDLLAMMFPTMFIKVVEPEPIIPIIEEPITEPIRVPKIRENLIPPPIEDVKVEIPVVVEEVIVETIEEVVEEIKVEESVSEIEPIQEVIKPIQHDKRPYNKKSNKR